MPKFITTHTERYELEADTMKEAQTFWHNQVLTGKDEAKFLDGLTTYEESLDN